jgi:hypothetical protein
MRLSFGGVALDLGFRPETYWPQTLTEQTVVGQIKGTARRRAVEGVLDSGEAIPPRIADTILEPSLTDEAREAFAAIHPSLMGGEFLPDYGEDEVEIARVAMSSTTGDVESVRALHAKNGRIGYRIGNEYDTGRRVKPATTARPLTMGQLIRMMDNAELLDPGEGYGVPSLDDGITFSYARRLFSDHGDADAIWGFLTVSSRFYPDLGRYYEDALAEYYCECVEDSLEGDVFGDEPDALQCAELIAGARSDPASITSRDEMARVA